MRIVIMRILLVEDDSNLNNLLSKQLLSYNYMVDSCLNGADALFHISQTLYDIIILDRRLPDMEGIDILREIRASNINTPVIFLTALSELNDKIEGFNAGADDYMIKPFHVEELIVRIKAVLRRPDTLQPDSIITCHDLSLNASTHTLSCNNASTNLTKTEFQLMELFLKNPYKVFSREVLLSCVWGACSEVEPNNVDNYVYFLRRHLKELKSASKIQTVYGVGYKLSNDDDTTIH